MYIIFAANERERGDTTRATSEYTRTTCSVKDKHIQHYPLTIQVSTEVLQQLMIGNEQLTKEKDQWTAEKDQWTAEKDQWTAEKDQWMAEKDQWMAEKEQLMTEKNQLQQELQTANSRADEQVQQLHQQVSDIKLTLSNGCSCVIVLIPSAVSHDDQCRGEGGATPLGGEERGGGGDQ